MRIGTAKTTPLAHDLDAALRSFSFNGASTRVEQRLGLPFYFNEFWTARQRQAHALHEVSYRACFKPQLPAFFIERLTAPGDTVCDPFMGRGTTPIQAVLMGRRAIGADVNPLSAMLAGPRAAPPTLEAIAARLALVPWAEGVIEDDALLVFYHPETLAELCGLRAWLLVREARGELDHVDAWISHGGDQSPERAFAGISVRLFAAAQPGGVARMHSAKSMQCADRRRRAATLQISS